MDVVVGGVIVSTSVDPLIANVITYLSDDSRKHVLQLLSDDSGIVRDLLDASILSPPLPVCPLVLPPHGVAFRQPTLCVFIFGGIIYTREDTSKD
ncbi:hypothetical protein Tco_0540975 [Tanacetum coccineum]